VKTVLFVSQ